MSTMPSGAAVCAAAGRTAQTQQRRVNTNFDFILLSKSFFICFALSRSRFAFYMFRAVALEVFRAAALALRA
jgi:hypothetical protein